MFRETFVNIIRESYLNAVGKCLRDQLNQVKGAETLVFRRLFSVVLDRASARLIRRDHAVGVVPGKQKLLTFSSLKFETQRFADTSDETTSR